MLEAPHGRDATPLLRVDGVHKVFAAADGAVEALRGIDIAIAEGEFVCLLGASGCGKSTLLRIIAGFEKATRGSVAVHGMAVNRRAPNSG
jgi:ABC-type Fe3+/spermidine/putrescine transport system ATPase subunit